MAKTDRNIIKQWFTTGSFPTEQQFWNWLDSFFHKDDLIPIASVDGLVALINNLPLSGSATSLAPASKTIDAGKLINAILLTSADSMTVKVGTTLGGNELDTYIIDANTSGLIDKRMYSDGSLTIYITPTTAGTCNYKIYTQ